MSEALKKNVFLCGFMGTGKSTVGAIASAALSLPPVDTDRIIERREGMTVREIFGEKGAGYFRKSEAELIKRLSFQSPRIISLGGGSILDRKNVEIMKKRGVIVFLDTPFQKVYERVKRNDRRPLANSCSDEELLALYNVRRPIYAAAADITVFCSDTARETANGLLLILREKGILAEE